MYTFVSIFKVRKINTKSTTKPTRTYLKTQKIPRKNYRNFSRGVKGSNFFRGCYVCKLMDEGIFPPFTTFYHVLPLTFKKLTGGT